MPKEPWRVALTKHARYLFWALALVSAVSLIIGWPHR